MNLIGNHWKRMKTARLAVALLALAAALPAAAQQLQLVDLGATGPGYTAFDAYRINAQDQVVGRGSAQDVRSFLWQRFAMADMGTLGGIRCNALDINNLGQVVGSSYVATGAEHAFVWEAGKGMRDLGFAYDPGVQFSTASDARAINDAGQVVGWGATGPSAWTGLVWETSPAVSGPVTLPFGQGYAMDVNGLGQVIGYFNSYPGTTGYLWEKGVLTLIPGLPSGEFTSVHAINDAGQVTGSTAAGGTAEYRGFLWERDASGAATTTDLGGLGGTLTAPTVLTADGRVVGQSMTATGDYHVFVWAPVTGMRDLGTLGGTWATAYAASLVNGTLVVVGQSTTAAGNNRAFIWRDGDAALTDLGTLGGTDSAAYDVNALGHAVGYATTTTGEGHAVLWTTRTTPDLLDDLVALARSFALAKDYTSKLTSAATYLTTGKTANACQSLGSFTSLVTAQSGKAVPELQAIQLAAGSKAISRLLGCK